MQVIPGSCISAWQGTQNVRLGQAAADWSAAAGVGWTASAWMLLRRWTCLHALSPGLSV